MTAIFQILKTVQGQDQDLKKMVLRTRLVLRTTSLVQIYYHNSKQVGIRFNLKEWGA